MTDLINGDTIAYLGASLMVAIALTLGFLQWREWSRIYSEEDDYADDSS